MTMRDNVEQIRSDTTEAGTVEGRAGRALSERFHTIAFWFVVVFLFGACAGVGAAFKYHSAQLDKSVQLGCFIHNGVAYDVSLKEK